MFFKKYFYYKNQLVKNQVVTICFSDVFAVDDEFRSYL